jgi:hypothetical protein
MHKLDLEAFRTTLSTGGIMSVTLIGEGGAFHVKAETRTGAALLTKARSSILREFKGVQQATVLLRQLGVLEFLVDTKNWQPELAEISRVKRPDKSAQLKEAHEARAYSAWLTEKVSQSQQGLIDGSNVRIAPEDWKQIRENKRLANT